MSDPVKIAIVVPSLPTGGGVSAVAWFLHDAIEHADGFTCDLISLAVRADDEASVRLVDPSTWGAAVEMQERTVEDTPYVHVGAYWSEFEFQRYQPRRQLTERLNEYDVIQVVAGIPAWALVARKAIPPVALQVATLARVERAMKLREGGGLLGMWRSLMTRVTRRLDTRGLRSSDIVFVENQWMEDHVRSTGANVVFAPPGVDVSRFHPSDRSFSDRDYLLSVGRFGDTRKNVSMLFRAYARVCDDNPAVPRLVLAGKTAPPDSAWALARQLGIRDSIDFHERVPLDELAALYRNARLFLLSSDEEGLGLVLLEAMASGVPVVSTDCGGPGTAVKDGETGMLTPVGDHRRFAQAIQHLVDAPDRLATLGRQARERAENMFSLEATSERFLNTYHDLVRTSPQFDQ